MYSYNNIINKYEPCNKDVIDSLKLSCSPTGEVTQYRVDKRVDVVVVENFLSSDECDQIIAACERVGYTFWRQKDPGSGGDAGACRGEAEARAFRVVDTIEANFPALSQILSSRIEMAVKLDTKTFSPSMDDADELFARDLEGTWVPQQLAQNLLFARYGAGGHFSPHIDGSTIVDVNTRSLYTLLVYLNDCEAGGETVLFSGEQAEVLKRDTASGKYVGRVENRIGAVKPTKGTAAFFYYDVLHEGSPVKEGCHKYIIRGDFLYRREPPILTADNDREAFELYERARVAESNGDVFAACEMFQRVRKLSKGVAELYQLVWLTPFHPKRCFGCPMEPGRFAEEYNRDDCPHQQYYKGYSDLSVHRLMLEDVQRMRFYRASIEQSADVEGKVVVDVGSGTGILSMWAVRAGAKHVFSIEAASLSEFQVGVVEDNELSSKITVLGDTVENIVACGVGSFISRHREKLGDSGIALLLSEWMGFYLLHEGMLPSVIRARNFFQDVNATLGVSQRVEMVPERATIFVSPVTCEPYYTAQYKSFWRDVAGFDFSRYGRVEYEMHVEQASPLVERLPPSCLLHEGMPLVELDLAKVQETELTSLQNTVYFDFGASVEFRRHLAEVGDDGYVAVDGFCLWFDVSYRGHTLSTSPRSPATHWKQTTVLLPGEARREELVRFSAEGGELGVEIHISATDEAARCYSIELELK